MLSELYPGVWKMTLGQPELATPTRLRFYQPAVDSLTRIAVQAECPIDAGQIEWKLTPRGCVVSLPLGKDEHIYGLGVQLLSLDQRGRKKVVRVNSDPQVDLGDSHAPSPFYVSTAGYGIFVDTARYATFYFGNARKVNLKSESSKSPEEGTSKEQVVVEIPSVKGVDVFIFAGPGMLDAIQHYNLFAGGGFVPPRWGLGFWYRCDLGFDHEQVISIADELHQDKIPCDVIGLEPGWQTHSYSCSFKWSDRFPDVEGFIDKLTRRNIHLNIWTHAFTDPSSPIYESLAPYSGDYQVWEGLVPDLTLPEAQKPLADFFNKEHVAKGVSGYKLDECDNSDFNPKAWSFPEASLFPSGLDGEQMHSFFGLKFQETVENIFIHRNQRTYGEVRSSHALASPYPYVLYSDLYDHEVFIRGLGNCGFSGHLWCPEVRHAESAEDLIRRMQAVVFSPQALINAFYIPNLPWKQFDAAKNKEGDFLDNWKELEARCRDILEMRMQFIPYLYAAFYRYFEKGTPPFRALVCDYPQDPNVWKIDNQFLVGDRLMVAPVVAGKSKRTIYLPPGDWYDFWTNERVTGGASIDVDVPLEIIPLYVKAGSILPLAKPTLNTADPESYRLSVRIFGDGSLPITLYEDDGKTYDYKKGQYSQIQISWDPETQKGQVSRSGNLKFPEYRIETWNFQNDKKRLT